MDVLIATWQAGGATQVAIGLGRLLVESGHRVRIFGPAELASRVAEAGCVHHSRIRQLAEAMRGYRGAADAVKALERLVGPQAEIGHVR